ncbi:E3 SUMO-protein ligase ZBED1-like [Lytechinus variegatus]|uniref:E3 SUMO-protein ligase ZBED1-like n=1 Tax=Lytechinus variegatus TaxID=7654 RepID=UPI001BB192EE|nr:E3 SUMO-protein ligase ZBED1-like [Lytechinus variegatus]
MGKASKVWEYFAKTSDSSVKCKLCDIVYKYTGGSTTTMNSHLVKKHPNTVTAPDQRQGPITSFFKTPPTPRRSEEITECIVSLVAKDGLPISCVEGEGLRGLIRTLEPGYTMPTRRTVTNRLKALYDVKRNSVRELLGEVPSVALTTDCWTSVGTKDYMTVTAHAIGDRWQRRNFILETKPVRGIEDEDEPQRHTTQALQNQLRRVTEEWGLMNKVVGVVHDNAANVRRVGEGILANDIGCAAHTLQLCINSALNSVPSIRSMSAAATRLVGHFKHSVIATNALESEQRQMGIEEHKLIQAVKTRWNSTFDMLRRLKEQRWAVCRVLSNRRYTNQTDARTLELTDHQWRLLEGLLDSLEPFKVATTVLSGEEHTTSSVVGPFMAGILDHHLTIGEDDLPGVQSFKRKAADELTRRFDLCPATDRGTAEASPITPTLKASALDPRHKRMSFVADSTREAVISAIREELPPPVPKRRRADGRDEDQPSTSALDFLLTGTKEAADDRGEEEAEVVDEVDAYLQRPAPPRATDPLLWWRDNEDAHPRVAQLAKKYLTLPATSVPSERVFSSAGNIVNKKRSCLEPENVDMLVFLKGNLKE